ncbi:hypothetical protein JY423_02440 [Stenotrophomonas maltophilia]|nr:hypothetical protein [Stenotrophomonas maltophilia]MBN4961118.1 hypothetical protein [Stenotrophomonas maltophilia]
MSNALKLQGLGEESGSMQAMSCASWQSCTSSISGKSSGGGGGGGGGGGTTDPVMQ